MDGANPLKAGEIHKDTKQACATQVDQDELFKSDTLVVPPRQRDQQSFNREFCCCFLLMGAGEPHRLFLE